MQHLTSNVYTETAFRGCNPSFVVTSEGVVLIDTPQLPFDGVKWREKILKRGPLRYLINTEPHGDHIAGNFLFPEATVVAHQGVKDRFPASIRVIDDLRGELEQQNPDRLWLLAPYKPHPPTITFTEKMTLYVGDHTFELVNLPGHTKPETAVYVPQERVLFTSDNVFHKVQVWLQEADPFEWLESLKKIEEFDVDFIVPGHGAVCDKLYIPEQATFIQDWIDAVQQAIDKGISKEEAAKTISFLDRYPMDVGLESFGPRVQEMNVNNLWDRLVARGGKKG
ncbi:MAG: MBL fold metallo-hydrolase [Candidatus Tectomicrobia bacterium]|nr:MBL fold metallo-hydrolase [Candidatus Tectomicrobia bacterium]